MELNAIKQMERHARNQTGVVSLGQGIPFLESDPSIRQDVIKAIMSGKADKYSDPQGLLMLRTKVAGQLAKEGLHYRPDEIIVTAGAIEALAATLLAIITPEKDEVIIPSPAYSAYVRSVNMAKGRVVPLQLNEAQSWRLPLDELEQKAGKNTAAILLCNPNNPTGTVYTKKELLAVCEFAKQHGILVVLDEVYKNMTYNNEPFYTPAAEPAFRKTIVRIMSFSKDFSVTGWRVGFLHADKSLVNTILPVHDTLINCAPVVSQYAAISALEHQAKIFAKTKHVFRRHRQLMAGYLDELADYLDYEMPEASYFFFPRFKEPIDSAAFCMDLLRCQKVAVVPGSDFGPGGEGHIRLCFGKTEREIRLGMEGLGRFLKSEQL